MDPVMDLGTLWKDCLVRSSQKTIDADLIKLVEDLTIVCRMIDVLGVFSTNETIEECTTGSLRYMTAEYYLGMTYTRFKTDRKENLMKAKDHLWSYLELVKSYGGFSEKPIPMECEPALKRQLKISRLHRIRDLEAILEQRPALINVDEEEERKFFLDEIQLQSLKCLEELEMVEMELMMLSNGLERTTPSVTSYPSVRKVGQSFTLLKSRMREGVFKPGHNLPTMTIDEYLELERQRGGIIPRSSNDADTDDKDEDRDGNDEEKLQAQRRMDDFKDEHRRGSGNTYNRG